MNPNAYLSSRLVDERIDAAARRAEYARQAAEQPERVAPPRAFAGGLRRVFAPRRTPKRAAGANATVCGSAPRAA